VTLCLAVVLCGCVAVSSTQGGVINDLARGLHYTGFTLSGDENLLSGGADFRAFTVFQGNPLDFGPLDLTLQGPVLFEFSTGGRGIKSLDIAFTTATSSADPAVPLTYALNLDAGNQEASIAGSLLVDGNFSINEFGFYDLTLRYSSRQDITALGPLTDGSRQNDFDLGPIDISGNIFADVLAAVFDPLFEQAGTPNVFAQFSGREKLQKAILAEAEQIRTDLAASSESGAGMDVGANVYAHPLAIGTGDAIAQVRSGHRRSVIPIPSTLVLLALPLPVLLARQLRRRRHA